MTWGSFSRTTRECFSGKLIAATGVAEAARVNSNPTRGRARRLVRLRRGAEVARQPRPSRLPPPRPTSQVFVNQKNCLWPGAFTHGLSAMTGLGLFCRVTLEPHNDLPWGSFCRIEQQNNPSASRGNQSRQQALRECAPGSVPFPTRGRAGRRGTPNRTVLRRLVRHAPALAVVQTS